MEKIRTWWNNGNIWIVQLDSGEIFALNGWNGEAFTGCWRCLDSSTPSPDGREYTLRPVYRYQAEGIDLDGLGENSPEWDAATEIVDYVVTP